MNPVDFGNTPLQNAAVRGALAAIVTGFLYAIYGLQDGRPLDQSIMMGAVPMLLGFLGLLGYGVVDQNRANTGVVNAADVPVQLEAKNPVAADMIPGHTRTPQTIARQWTRDYQRRNPPYDR